MVTIFIVNSNKVNIYNTYKKIFTSFNLNFYDYYLLLGVKSSLEHIFNEPRVGSTFERIGTPVRADMRAV